MLKVGQPAPDFTLDSSDGGSVTLSSFRGKKAVIVFFYPGDDTAGCTREACSFRDAYEVLASKDVVVLGVNSASVASHRKFATKYRLPFPLLVDEGWRVSKSYGVARTLGIIPGRETFLIDRDGILRARFSSQFQPMEHLKQIKSALETLHR